MFIILYNSIYTILDYIHVKLQTTETLPTTSPTRVLREFDLHHRDVPHVRDLQKGARLWKKRGRLKISSNFIFLGGNASKMVKVIHCISLPCPNFLEGGVGRVNRSCYSLR